MGSDIGGGGAGFSLFGLSLSTILLIAGIYFAFLKKKGNKNMGYMLLLGWALTSGMLGGILTTG